MVSQLKKALFSAFSIIEVNIGIYRAPTEGVDPATGAVKWTVRTERPQVGGVLATAGGLIFTGRTSGSFDAYDAKTGDPLWRFRMGAGCNAAPMTYQVAGRQYVAVACGGDGNFETQGGDALVAFSLP